MQGITLVERRKWPVKGIFDLAISGDGRVLVSGHKFTDDAIVLWNAADGSRLKRIDLGRQWRSGAIAMSPDGAHVLSGGADGAISVWNVARSTVVSTMQGHTKGATRIVFSRDGQYAASCAFDGTVRVWRTGAAGAGRSDACVATFRCSSTYVQDIAISPSNRFLAACAGSATEQTGEFHVWELPSGRELSVTERTNEKSYGVAFSPDERLLAIAGGEIVSLWNMTGPACALARRASLPAFNITVRVAFSRAGKCLFAAGLNYPRCGTICGWSLAGPTELFATWAHGNNCPVLVLSPDGKCLYTGGCEQHDDETEVIRAWDLPASLEG